MPPDEFLHPFAGTVTVMTLKRRLGFPVLALSHHSDGQCVIWLPAPDDPEISLSLRACLREIEIANCNGAQDGNNPAVWAQMRTTEQARYGRVCW